MANTTSLASMNLTASTAISSIVQAPTAVSYPIGDYNFTTTPYNVSNSLYARSKSSSASYYNGSVFLQAYNNTFTPREYTRRYFKTDYNDSDPHALDYIKGPRNLTPEQLAAANLNITLYNNNITTLTFDSTDIGFDALARRIHGFFNKDTFSRPIFCSYPISGQYGSLPRILFYVLLLFSLVFRHHIWISTAALGTAMTYSASAAVHAFALFVRYKGYTVENFTDNPVDAFDNDIQGIYPVLVAGCIMLTPVLNWSLTIRRNDARPVVVLWGLLIFAAALGCITILYRSNGLPLLYPSTAICQQDNSNTICNAEVYRNGDVDQVSKSAYSKCGCVDLCAVIQSSQPFRKNTQMGAFLFSDKINKIYARNGRAIDNLYLTNTIILGIVIIQGFLGLIEAQVSQKAVRNWLYRKLTKGKIHDRFLIKVRSGLSQASRRENASGEPGPMERFGIAALKEFARCFAAAAYLFSMLLAAVCVPLFFLSLVINEIEVRGYPSSEEFDAVGQWSTWVGAAFVLIAAFIVRYSPAVLNSVGRSYGATLRTIRRSNVSRERRQSMRVLRRDTKTGVFSVVKDEESSTDSSTDMGTKKNSISASIRNGIGEGWDNTKRDLGLCAHEAARPFRVFWAAMVSAWVATMDSKNEFVDWWRDPDAHSTWDWVIIDDEDVSRSLEFDELGELYQSWDTKPEALSTLVGPYFRKDRTPAPHPERYQKPVPDHTHVLQSVPHPIKSHHTNFNVFAAALDSLKRDIQLHNPDLLPKDEKTMTTWLKRSYALLADHTDDHGYYHKHCSCATQKDHPPLYLDTDPFQRDGASKPTAPATEVEEKFIVTGVVEEKPLPEPRAKYELPSTTTESSPISPLEASPEHEPFLANPEPVDRSVGGMSPPISKFNPHVGRRTGL